MMMILMKTASENEMMKMLRKMMMTIGKTRAGNDNDDGDMEQVMVMVTMVMMIHSRAMKNHS